MSFLVDPVYFLAYKATYKNLFVLHTTNGEPLLAQILEGCSYMIYPIVDDKEPVMRFACTFFGKGKWTFFDCTVLIKMIIFAV